MEETANNPSAKHRLPPWLRKRLPQGGGVAETRAILQELGLETVCRSAHCPNLPECFARHTATFMILGSHCTRNCRFCAVDHAPPDPVREDEPQAVAEAAARMQLQHVVVTSVTRDDLPDGGAAHFARVIRAIRQRSPEAIVEVLTPDFQGLRESIATVIAAAPNIFNHNIETVPRLYPAIRPQAGYERSLEVLRYAGELSAGQGTGAAPKLYTKSGLMVGCGETREELSAVLADLRRANCQILTVGQYLAPSGSHFPVVRFLPPEEFAEIEAEARRLGFAAVASGPFVRSSYNAQAVFESI
jgi:lipoic acid synthetase